MPVGAVEEAATEEPVALEEAAEVAVEEAAWSRRATVTNIH